MNPDPGEITQLLQQWRSGDRQVENRLFELLTPEMNQIAERCFRRERPGNSLQATAPVNEAFLRLTDTFPTTSTIKELLTPTSRVSTKP
jgi:hypothetical protein